MNISKETIERVKSEGFVIDFTDSLCYDTTPKKAVKELSRRINVLNNGLANSLSIELEQVEKTNRLIAKYEGQRQAYKEKLDMIMSD